jgi:hypothetical protein
MLKIPSISDVFLWIVHSLPLIFRFIIVITRETEHLEKLGVVIIGTALVFDDCQEEAE